MPKVLFVSDYACETGFGTVSKNIVAELKRHFKGDLKMDIIANNYFGEAYDEDENIFVAPAKINDVKLDDYGRHFFLSALKNSNEYDILFIISDLGVVVPIIEILEAIKKEKREKNMKSFKSMYYFPMDCHGFPQILKGLEFFDVLVTYTEFGRNEILKVRPELRSKLKVINHGTNINDFYPLEPSDVFKFRNEFFGDVHSKCIISNINRNQPRKDIPTTIFAFKEAKECWNAEYPKPFLYLHMHPRDPMGWDLRAIFWQLDLVEGEDYKLLPDEWIDNMPPAATINNILNASDAYLTTTLAEGWGLCLEGSTKVLLSGCVKRIDAIKIGDFVLSNDGKYHKVLDTTCRVVDTFYKIKPTGCEEISVSPEHPFFVLRKNSTVPQWVNVDDMLKNDFIGIRKPIGNGKLIGKTFDIIDHIEKNKYQYDETHVWHNMGFSSMDKKWSYTSISERYGVSKSIGEAAKKHINRIKISKNKSVLELAIKMQSDGYELVPPVKIKRYFTITKELLEIFGWYLAEGSCGKGNRLEFDTNLRCIAEMQKLGNNLKQIFGCNFTVEKNGTHKCRARISSCILSDLFSSLLGKGAFNKHVPEVFSGCEKSLMPIVHGYISGDGCINEKMSHLSYSTVSPSLAYQIRNILISNGIFCSVMFQKRRGFGNYDSYTSVIFREFLNRYGSLVGVKYDFKTKTGRVQGTGNYIKENDTHFFVSFVKETKFGYPVDMYDLCVEDAHSFTANGIVCHNTVTEAMAARIPVICPLNTSLTEMTSNGKRAITYETFYPVINTTDQIIRQQGDIGDVAACILKLADMRYDSTKNSFFDAANMLNNAYAWATGLTWHELSKRWIEYIKELS